MKIVWPSCQIIHIKRHTKLHTQTHTPVPCNVMSRACKKTSKKIHSFKHTKCTNLVQIPSAQFWILIQEYVDYVSQCHPNFMILAILQLFKLSWSTRFMWPQSPFFFLKVIHTKLHRWNHQNPKQVKLLHKNQIPEKSYLIPFATTKLYSNFWN
jgi:hypothetical protein